MKKLFFACLLTTSSLLFAQKPFGLDSLSKIKPIDFIPDLTQFPNVRDFALSPDGTEAFFTAQSHFDELSVLMYVRKEKERWTYPRVAKFSGTYFDLEPFFSSDGLRLYFASNRTLKEDDRKTKDFDIWYVERKTLRDSWSSPINMGSPVNSEFDEFYPSLAANRNLYFTSGRTGSKGKDDVFFSEYNGGSYSEPISLSDSINSENYEFNAFVTPDESLLFFTAYQRKDGFGSGDLYCSKRDANGNWGKAFNLGPQVNSDKMDYCPFLDLKSKTLYFTSKRNALLKESEPIESAKDLIYLMQSYENGLSRLYWIQL